jgi:outer membrane protein OmpA-like peptidoglycan-associated protein
MKTTYIKSTTFIICLLIPLLISAQQINTLYFMNNVPQRNAYNPAFQPRCGFYIDLPITPNLKLDVGNNSFSINSFIFKQNINGVDSTITFLHPEADKQAFLDKIRPTTRIFTDFQISLFEFGFRAKKSYFTFGIKERFENSIFLPKDIFRLAIFGTPETETDNSFDFKTLGINTSLFTEFGLGYSYKINKSLTVGTKLKALVGQANISTNVSTLSLNASMDRWLLKANASINTSTPIEIPLDNENNFDFPNITLPDFNQTFFLNQLNADNLGYGIDLGVTFRPVNFLQLSAALTDLGFIRWKKGITNASVEGEYEFEGINLDISEDINLEEIGQQYLDELTNAFAITPNKQAYTTSLTTKLNIGAEVSALNDKIGVGLLSRTMFANKSMFQELTASLNLRPLTWLSASASYSLFDGEYSTIGVGLQFRLGMINMYIAGDYMPARFTTDFIPTRQKQVNLEAGINWQFRNIEKHKKSENAKKQKKVKEKTLKKEGLKFPMFITYEEKIKDADNDGVKNKKDKCPDTPLGYLVDEFGCTVDTDKDGVADNVDKCPDTPLGIVVDSVGCPIDTDKDNVPDYLDKCPNTPANVIVDKNGCPIDTDKDGIADYLDKCPDTPTAVVVDAHGCPVDSDKDGIPDYLDKCPDTPEKAHGTIDNNGCPIDSDGDGVPDYLDKCPDDTPKEAFGKIDANGCVLDTDGDGLPDYRDNCPTIPGVESNQGCPEIKAAVKRLFQQALQGIQFETGKDVIKSTSFGILNQIVKIMNDNPDYLLLINGHTDNVGNATLNQTLSEKRANAVKKYLMQKGINSERMTAQGFGDSIPVADNSTTKGKALNRRVEFVVKFEK